MSHTTLKLFIVILLFVWSCTDLGEPPEPTLSFTVNQNQINFGTVRIVNTKTDSVYIASDGTHSVSLSLTLITGSSVFKILSSTSLSIEPEDISIVVVSYSPGDDTTSITHSDTLRISNNDDVNQVALVSLSGMWSTIPIPDISVSLSAVDFGVISLGDSTDETITFSNQGDTTLIVSDFSIGGKDPNDFSFFPQIDTLYLETGDDTTITLQFKPITSGDKSAKLSIRSNDPDAQELDIVLSGLAGYTYSTHVAPIIGSTGSAGCLSSCHTFVTSSGWTYDAIVNVQSSTGNGKNYITPGDTLNSYLYLKIIGDASISGSKMPADNPSYFDNNTDQLNIIREWIIQGAIE
ncbi:MAG: choice-of-anchor D domain-containing protein [Candidatus Marinimicrobia bacterium]|nr:choice-of-anchor D domain-containing protein [Candidatus Neomarinimicrobiota bacterium]